MTKPDATILGAWTRRQKALATIMSRGTYHDSEQHSLPEVDRYDAADAIIHEAPATTLAGAKAQAWAAWAHQRPNPIAGEQHGDLIRTADLAGLEAEEEAGRLDYPEKVILRVLQALTALQAPATA